MSGVAFATRDELVAQLVAQCWPHEALAGDVSGARANAERTVERLESRGVSFTADARGTGRIDLYAANLALKARKGAPCDPAWPAWQETIRRNLRALEQGPHHVTFTLRREWHLLPQDSPRSLVLRLPLPLEARERPADLSVRLLQSAGALLSQTRADGRVELRLAPEAARAPVIAEVTFSCVAGDTAQALDDAAPLASVNEWIEEPDRLWLAEKEGRIARSARLDAVAAELTRECEAVAHTRGSSATTIDFARAAWARIFARFVFGDLHHAALGSAAPLEVLWDAPVVDCTLGASLLIALCRARGIPARLVSGYLLTPGLPSRHSWAEVLIAPDRWAPMDVNCWDPAGGDPLDPYGATFFGRVDARLTCEIAPRQFTGWGSARAPAAWVKLLEMQEGGLTQTIRDAHTHAVATREWAHVTLRGPQR